jgi:hypothetical protein
VEYLGADRLVYGFVHGFDDVLVLSKVPSNVRVSLDVDTDYEFAVPYSDICYFDKVSGDRVDQPAVTEAV